MTPPPVTAIGYLRVSTEEQGESGLGLAAQESSVRAEADRRGWSVEVLAEVASGGKADRPMLTDALTRLDAGQADVLIVAKLDRLSRSVIHGAQAIERAQRHGWSLVILDLGVDLSTPAGEMTANVVLSAAQFERRMIGQRTREAMAAARARGTHCGRRTAVSAETAGRVLAERAEGRSLRAIARGLNADGVPAAQGGQWTADGVLRVAARGQRAGS